MNQVKLFVRNLPFSLTDDGLREIFAGVGEPVSAKVVVDRYTNKSRGFGFVEMSSKEEAQKAIDELNGHEVDGRGIVIDFARENRSDDRPRGGNDRNGGGGQRNSGDRRPPRHERSAY